MNKYLSEGHNLMSHAFIGYHGTCRRKAKCITDNHEYKLSIDTDGHPQWLGDGIYLFENSVAWAKKYAVEVKKFYSDYAVVRSEICAQTVFDLTEPDDNDFFNYVAEQMIAPYVNNGEKPRLLNGCILNFIYNNLKKYDVARSVFLWDTDIGKDGWTNIPLSHTQLCVRHSECVKTYERVEVN